MNERHGNDGVNLAALYAEVYAKPDDDDLRWVLADALLAIGDPRGEFIVAQLDPARDHQRRAMRLRQQYGLTWLGALRGAVIPLDYARGFLTSCQTLEIGDSLRGVFEWATVEHIELTGGRNEDLGYLSWPVLRSLRRVSGVRRTQLGVVCGVARLQHIQLLDGTSIRRGADGQWQFPSEVPGEDDDQ